MKSSSQNTFATLTSSYYQVINLLGVLPLEKVGSKISKLKAFKAQLNPESDFVKGSFFLLEEEGLKGQKEGSPKRKHKTTSSFTEIIYEQPEQSKSFQFNYNSKQAVTIF